MSVDYQCLTLLANSGICFRVFYRWLKPDYDSLFGGLPDQTRLQRSLAAHEEWLDLFLEPPSAFMVMDNYPSKLRFPIRQGRSQRQTGKKGRNKGRNGERFWVMLDTYGCNVE